MTFVSSSDVLGVRDESGSLRRAPFRVPFAPATNTDGGGSDVAQVEVAASTRVRALHTIRRTGEWCSSGGRHLTTSIAYRMRPIVHDGRRLADCEGSRERPSGAVRVTEKSASLTCVAAVTGRRSGHRRA